MTPLDKRLVELNASLIDSTKIVEELVAERKELVIDNEALRMKLEQALEHLKTSRAQAMKLAEELDKYQKP